MKLLFGSLKTFAKTIKWSWNYCECILVTWALDKQVKMMCKVFVSANGTFIIWMKPVCVHFLLLLFIGVAFFHWIFFEKIFKHRCTNKMCNACTIRLLLVWKLMGIFFLCRANCKMDTISLCVFEYTLHKFMRYPNNNNTLINVPDLSKYPAHFACLVLNLCGVCTLYAFPHFRFLQSFSFVCARHWSNWL